MRYLLLYLVLLATAFNAGCTKPDTAADITQGKGKTASPASKALLPPFTNHLVGRNELRVRNPNDFSVRVGARSGQGGKDFGVGSNGVASVFVPDGKYDIYFVYSNQPDALYQGDSFQLRGNGVEIQIVKVVDGNYGVRRVK